MKKLKGMLAATLCLGTVLACQAGDGSDESGFVPPPADRKLPPPPPRTSSSAETLDCCSCCPVTPMTRTEAKKPPKPPTNTRFRVQAKHRGADQVKTRLRPDDGCAAAKAAPRQ